MGLTCLSFQATFSRSRETRLVMPDMSTRVSSNTFYGVGVSVKDVVGMSVKRLVHGTSVNTRFSHATLNKIISLNRVGFQIASV